MSKLTNEEMDWMKKRFHNYGTSQIPSVVSNCLFLSPGAKQLYSNLCQHAFGEKKNCFPSQSRLMLELNMAPGTLNEYLKELREQDLIETTPTPYGNLNYRLERIWKPFCLYHSEWIWLLIKEVSKLRGISYQKMKKDIKEYKQSVLYNEIVYSFNGTEHIQRLYEWFGEKWDVDPVVKYNEDEWIVTLSLED